jgi:hypothetical protein
VYDRRPTPRSSKATEARTIGCLDLRLQVGGGRARGNTTHTHIPTPAVYFIFFCAAGCGSRGSLLRSTKETLAPNLQKSLFRFEFWLVGEVGAMAELEPEPIQFLHCAVCRSGRGRSHSTGMDKRGGGEFPIPCRASAMMRRASLDLAVWRSSLALSLLLRWHACLPVQL